MKYLLPAITVFLWFGLLPTRIFAQTAEASWWSVRSVDTMKYSRDMARLKSGDKSFDSVIDIQIKNIAGTGANYVAIGTPYDEEFTPFLRRWVKAARKYGLKVWFRGNWSGWEGWFGYPAISGQDHLKKTVEFINKNRDLFADGDIFTPCPECENGGPGDPRKTGDRGGFAQFLIDEYQATSAVFNQLGLKVATNFASMNADVAKLIMDKLTTVAMGGLVVIDHYVTSPDKLVSDALEISDMAGGRVVLGEFGVPIPDLNSGMTEEGQAEWIGSALSELARQPSLAGLNYWVNVGGSTQLWTATGSARKAVSVVKSFYSPPALLITVRNEINEKLSGATVYYRGRSFTTDDSGQVSIPLNPDTRQINISAKDYQKYNLLIDGNRISTEAVLTKAHEGWLFKLRKFSTRVLSIINPGWQRQ